MKSLFILALLLFSSTALASRDEWIARCQNPASEAERNTFFSIRMTMNASGADCPTLYDGYSAQQSVILRTSFQTAVSLWPLLEFKSKGHVEVAATQIVDEHLIEEFKGIKTFALEVVTLRSNTNHLKKLEGLERLVLKSHSPFGPMDGLRELNNLKILGLEAPDLVDLGFLESGFSSLKGIVLDKVPARDFSPVARLESLETLSMANTQPESFEFLRSMTSLQRLNLNMTPIMDLNPLRGLNDLIQLDLSKGIGHEPITELEPIRDLYFLEHLNISGNDVKSISPLMNMAHMENLDLTKNNRIDDLSAVRNMVQLRRLVYKCLKETVRDENMPMKYREVPCDDPPLLDITPLKELEYLEELHLVYNQIYDIRPIENITSLKTLNLGGNLLNRVDSLAKLENLEQLVLGWNLVEDVTPLAGLTRLSYLDLQQNLIESVEPLANLASLTQLILNGNPLRSIEGLQDKPFLFNLSLGRTEITDLAPIAGNTGLTTLVLSWTPISNITHLRGLPHLSRLDLSQCKVSDISPILGSRSLVELNIEGLDLSSVPEFQTWSLQGLRAAGTTLGSLQPLRNLTNLKYLDVSNTGIDSLAGIRSARGLIYLLAAENEIEDISPLRGAQLGFLNLDNNRIRDLSPLHGMVSLRGLFLSYNNIEDVGPLSSLQFVTFHDSFTMRLLTSPGFNAALKLKGNRIKDVAPLALIPLLGHLEIESNELESIEPLRNNQNLEILRISNNRVTDLSPLAGNQALRVLFAEHNPVDSIDSLATNHSLQMLSLDVPSTERLQKLSDIVKSLPGVGSVDMETDIPFQNLTIFFQGARALTRISAHQSTYERKVGFRGRGNIFLAKAASFINYSGEILNYEADGMGRQEERTQNGLAIIQGPFKKGQAHGKEVEFTAYVGTPQGLQMSNRIKGEYALGEPFGQMELFNAAGKFLGRGVYIPFKKAFFGMVQSEGADGNTYYRKGLETRARAVGWHTAYFDEDLNELMGEFFFKEGFLHGDYKFYWRNGNLKEEGFYENGKIQGIFKYFFEGGTTQAEYTYVNGITHGPMKDYYPNGQVRIEGTNVNGKLNGPMRLWGADGLLLYEGQFVDGRIEGPTRAAMFKCNFDYYRGDFFQTRPVRDNGTRGVLVDFDGVEHPGEWRNGAFHFDEGGSEDSCLAHSEFQLTDN